MTIRADRIVRERLNLFSLLKARLYHTCTHAYIHMGKNSRDTHSNKTEFSVHTGTSESTARKNIQHFSIWATGKVSLPLQTRALSNRAHYLEYHKEGKILLRKTLSKYFSVVVGYAAYYSSTYRHIITIINLYVGFIALYLLLYIKQRIKYRYRVKVKLKSVGAWDMST